MDLSPTVQPLRMIDVANPDGSPGPNLWALVCQARPQVMAEDQGGGPWSNYRDDALIMVLPEATSCAWQLAAQGEPVVLVRANAASWSWLLLATEWPPGAVLLER